MKATLALQPELSEIRKQHGKDLRAQNEAIQALYKRHGITPTSPYLPLLVQTPILIGLFSALNIVLNHAKLGRLPNHRQLKGVHRKKELPPVGTEKTQGRIDHKLT